MVDRLLAVEDRHREQDRAELPDAEEDRGGLRRRRQHDGDPVTAPDAVTGERMRRLVREVLELAPVSSRVEPSKLSQTIAGLSRGCLSQTSAAML